MSDNNRSDAANIPNIPDFEQRRKLRRKRRRRRRIIALTTTIILLIAAALAFTIVYAYRDFAGLDGDGKSFTIDIPENADADSVANLLSAKEIISCKPAFKFYAGDRYNYQAGRYQLSSDMSYAEILETFAIRKSQQAVETLTLTIPEGYEIRQVAELVAENGLVSADEFIKEAENGVFDFDFLNDITRTENKLEGYLFPSTYEFSTADDAHAIINKMLQGFEDNILPIYNSAQTDYTLDEAVILASIIEREAGTEDEMPIVSSVFNNRMYAGMKLESCATVQYILKERKTVLSNEDTAIDSPYNTYMYSGLPVGPIASPGAAAMRAALSPADTQYMYFVADPNGGKNYFSTTYEEHLDKQTRLQNGEPVE